MSEDKSRFHGGQKRPVNGVKRVAFSVQLSSLLDQWSPEERPSRSARNAAKLSVQDSSKFPDMTMDVVHLSPNFAYKIQVCFSH